MLESQWFCGAARGIRTPDPIITNDVLYQLSYCGNAGRFEIAAGRWIRKQGACHPGAAARSAAAPTPGPGTHRAGSVALGPGSAAHHSAALRAALRPG